MKPGVLVARAIPERVLQRLRMHFDVEANVQDLVWPRATLIQRLQGKAGVFVTPTETVDAELLAACPDLRAVCSMAVGYNNIDVAACTARGILVSNAPGVLTETSADFGFALLLATARRMSEAERYLRRGEWTQWGVDLLTGQDVHGRTLGVLGMGRIGQAIARRGVLGFGMTLLYHNRSRLPSAIEANLGASHVDLATLLRESDHLVIVVPYGPDTHHLVGATELALMKPSATLVHMARGGVVDDAALVQALQAGQLAAAGLDVFEGEPALHPGLLTLPNVVLTPHIASASRATRLAMCELAADNLIAALAGGCPPTALNPQVLRPRG